MKKTLLLNSQISAAIAEMGHTDTLVISDCGLPIKDGPKRIDLALKRGVPGFMETLVTVLSELYIEKVIMAEEIKTHSPQIHREILKIVKTYAEVEYISHADFKIKSGEAKAVIRTGECTPYANVILVSGVKFDQ
ncbi:D-ribose pyranase [Clostridiales bacterium COT073_COT-073]|nr:D-ribose pyranase [Clostridiales bacterium COT073_COT-073]